MAVITPTKIASGAGRVTLSVTTLGASDTFVYTNGVTRYLLLRNGTAGALTPIIDGDGAVSEYLPGVGSVSTSSGYSVGSIAAGATVTVDLDAIRSYLKGVITITGGVGISASVLEF